MLLRGTAGGLVRVRVNGGPPHTAPFKPVWDTEDERTAFILSPAAVATGRQGEGIGQAQLSQGMNNLRKDGVDVIVTYGDPNFYSKAGFDRITEEIARAPLPLSYPVGWLGKSMTAEALIQFQGAPTCIAPTNDASLW